MNTEQAVRALSAKKWWELDNVIYTAITPDGTSGSAWPDRLEKALYHVEDIAMGVFASNDFTPMSDLKPRVVAILKGDLFKAEERTTHSVCAEIAQRSFQQLPADATGYIREKFTDDDIEAMDLVWIVVTHKAIRINDAWYWLSAHRFDNGSWVSAYQCRPEHRLWDKEFGFACEVPENKLLELIEGLGIQLK